MMANCPGGSSGSEVTMAVLNIETALFYCFTRHCHQLPCIFYAAVIAIYGLLLRLRNEALWTASISRGSSCDYFGRLLQGTRSGPSRHQWIYRRWSFEVGLSTQYHLRSRR